MGVADVLLAVGQGQEICTTNVKLKGDALQSAARDASRYKLV